MAAVEHDQLRPFSLFALLVTGMLLGALLGAATNAVNGAVSPDYFRIVLRFSGGTWSAAVAQGIFEGLLFGAGFSLIFVMGAGLISRGRLRFGLGLRYLTLIVLGAAVFWLGGGLAGAGLAALSPEFFRHAFPLAPDGAGLTAFAWVGGSIWGAELGGLACLLLALVALRNRWLERAVLAARNSC